MGGFAESGGISGVLFRETQDPPISWSGDSELTPTRANQSHSDRDSVVMRADPFASMGSLEMCAHRLHWLRLSLFPPPLSTLFFFLHCTLLFPPFNFFQPFDLSN